MIGLSKGAVQLNQYDSSWRSSFEKEAENIRMLLCNLIIDIQHVGSTSVPGLGAKPIIDMLIGLKSFEDSIKVIGILENNGYLYRLHASTDTRAFFVKGDESCRTHHIHVVQRDGEDWVNMTAFRDYLIKHEEALKGYMDIKKNLAELYKNDRDSYTKGKNAYIQEIIQKAREEFGY